jgi:hypothetical protein
MALVGAVHDCISKAKSLRRLAVRRRELQANCAGFAQASYPRVAEFLAANLALVFAYILDLLLVGVIAEYFATQRFPNSPAMAAVARYLVPAALIGMENAVAVHLADGRQRAGSRLPVACWIAFGILWALTVPVMVYGAQEVLGTAIDGPASAGYGVLTGGLVALAVTLHLFVLFSGEFNRFAQGYLMYAGHDGVLALRQWALARSWRASTRRVRVQFADLDGAKKEHQARFNEDVALPLPERLTTTLPARRPLVDADGADN